MRFDDTEPELALLESIGNRQLFQRVDVLGNEHESPHPPPIRKLRRGRRRHGVLVEHKTCPTCTMKAGEEL
jgi:hypothetical protein